MFNRQIHHLLCHIMLPRVMQHNPSIHCSTISFTWTIFKFFLTVYKVVNSKGAKEARLKMPEISEFPLVPPLIIIIIIISLFRTKQHNHQIKHWTNVTEDNMRKLNRIPARLFLARDSIYAIARYMPSPVRPSVCPSVCLSVCLSHGWISQRRLKLGSRNLHHRVAPW